MSSTRQSPSLGELFTRLEQEGLVHGPWRERVAAAMAREQEVQPWYVRTMIGFSAWIASLLLIIFIVAPGMDGGAVVWGLVLLAAAIALRFRLDHDFTNQVALALNLAGQGLVAFGLAEGTGRDEVEVVCAATIAMNLVLIPLYRDALFRFLAVQFAVTALVVLLYALKLNALVPPLAPLLCAAAIALWWRDGRLSGMLGPDPGPALMAGLLFAAFGCTLLSGVYLFPEWIDDFQFYPRPWISTIGLGALLLLLMHRILVDPLGGLASPAVLALLVMTVLLLVVTLPAPGVALSLTALTMGMARGDRMTTGLGIGFLTVFTAAWFYGMETSLLTKSYTLAGAGVLVLTARWLLRRLIPATREENHA